jgi:hypothetical protein
MGGVEALPDAWVDKVTRLNPEPDLAQIAKALSEVIQEQQQRATALLSLS